MSSSYLNLAYNNSMVEKDEYQGELSPFILANYDPSSLPYPPFFNKPHDQGANDRDHHLHKQLQQQEPKVPLLISGSSGRSVSNPIDNYGDSHTLKLSLCDQYVGEEETHDQPNQWMSSKMRLMRKMTSCDRVVLNNPRRKLYADQDQSQQNHALSSTSNSRDSSSGIIRVCSDCNTTKTPLWRSGPQGPKSLCNACGIRQRKARRAMAVAAAAENGGMIPPTHSPPKERKEKNLVADRNIPFKKRCKIATSAGNKKKFCVEDNRISLSTDSAFHRVFPQDERDAAILLMALSYGLVRS